MSLPPAKINANQYSIQYYPVPSIVGGPSPSGQITAYVLPDTPPSDIQALQGPYIPGNVYSGSDVSYYPNHLPGLSSHFAYRPPVKNTPIMLVPPAAMAKQSHMVLFLVLAAAGIGALLLYKYRGKLKSILKFG